MSWQQAVGALLQSIIACQSDARLRVSPVWAVRVSNNDHLSLRRDTGMSVPWITFPWMNLLSFSPHFHVLTTSRLACISGIIASPQRQKNKDWIFPEERGAEKSILRHNEFFLNTNTETKRIDCVAVSMSVMYMSRHCDVVWLQINEDPACVGEPQVRQLVTIYN